MTKMLLDDTDRSRDDLATFICARCSNQVDAPESSPPTRCTGCGAVWNVHEFWGSAEDPGDVSKAIAESAVSYRARLAGNEPGAL